jgi:hypothetical protein
MTPRVSPLLVALGFALCAFAIGRSLDYRRRLRRPLRDYEMLLADRPSRIRALTTPRR